jgi:hypothetical protein
MVHRPNQAVYVLNEYKTFYVQEAVGLTHMWAYI